MCNSVKYLRHVIYFLLSNKYKLKGDFRVIYSYEKIIIIIKDALKIIVIIKDTFKKFTEYKNYIYDIEIYIFYESILQADPEI